MTSRHVLVVGDGTIESLNIYHRLESLGYEVISVADNSEITLLKSAKNSPKLALLDFMHEVEISDDSTARRIEQVLNIPVIYVADERTQKKTGWNERLQPSGYLLRPLDDIELKASIELALNRQKQQISSPAQDEIVNEIDIDKQPASATYRKGVEEAYEVLRRIPTFESLPEIALRKLAEHSQFAKVLPGEYIAFEGDQNERSFILISGRFAMTKTSVAGKELVVELLGPGDFFGLVFAMQQLPAELSARAQTESEILWIRTSALVLVLGDHPKLYKGFAEYLCHRLHLSHCASHGLAHDSVKVRIASLILSLLAKYARVRTEANSPLIIDITRQQIADLTGTTAESAIRMTREMHSEEIINISVPGVLEIVDLEKLKKLASM